MKAMVQWQSDVCFLAESETGHQLLLDGPAEAGGQNKGPRPMELVLLGLGGCASYDVVTILKKSRQNVEGCKVQLLADRAEATPAVFTKIQLHFVIQRGRHQRTACCAGSSALGREVLLCIEKCSKPAALRSLTALRSRGCWDEAARCNPMVSGISRCLCRTWLRAEHFFVDLMGMDIEWRPDPDNVYLTSGNDNLALHQVAAVGEQGALDHIGFFINDPDQIEPWFEFLTENGVEMLTAPRTHRDGAISF